MSRQSTILEHADLIADGERFFLVMGDQNGAGLARLEDLAHLVAEAPTKLYVEVGEGLVEQQQGRFRAPVRASATRCC